MPKIIDITPELIQDLLSCEKKIIATPSPKNKANGQYKQTDFPIESTDSKYRFKAYIREHVELKEFFSVGLVYEPDDATSIIIVRYNGSHGIHKNQLTGELIDSFHIHTISVEAIIAGLKGESQASVTSKYSTTNEALISMCKDLNILNYKEYFSDRLQKELFS